MRRIVTDEVDYMRARYVQIDLENLGHYVEKWEQVGVSDLLDPTLRPEIIVASHKATRSADAMRVALTDARPYDLEAEVARLKPVPSLYLPSTGDTVASELEEVEASEAEEQQMEREDPLPPWLLDSLKIAHMIGMTRDHVYRTMSHNTHYPFWNRTSHRRVIERMALEACLKVFNIPIVNPLPPLEQLVVAWGNRRMGVGR